MLRDIQEMEEGWEKREIVDLQGLARLLLRTGTGMRWEMDAAIKERGKSLQRQRTFPLGAPF